MQEKKTEPYPGYATGKVNVDKTGKRTRDYKMFDCLIRAKFILFRERDSHKKISNDYFPDAASKVETTMRMGLKGGLHLLGSEDQPNNVCTLHFDGHKHLQRNVDKARIIDRLKGLRNYCGFADPLLLGFA